MNSEAAAAAAAAAAVYVHTVCIPLSTCPLKRETNISCGLFFLFFCLRMNKKKKSGAVNQLRLVTWDSRLKTAIIFLFIFLFIFIFI